MATAVVGFGKPSDDGVSIAHCIAQFVDGSIHDHRLHKTVPRGRPESAIKAANLTHATIDASRTGQAIHADVGQRTEMLAAGRTD
jgi:hypothetical protein